MAKKQTIKISSYSDSVGGFPSNCSGGFHHVRIFIPNDGLHISNDGDGLTIRGKWDKSRFQMPRVGDGIMNLEDLTYQFSTDLDFDALKDWCAVLGVTYEEPPIDDMYPDWEAELRTEIQEALFDVFSGEDNEE